MLSIAAAAELLGVPAHEVVSVDDAPAGDVIVTHRGAVFVVVPGDRPDGAGRSGLMFLTAPSVDYRGSFPIYTLADDDVVERDAGVVSKADLLATARELGIDANGKWGEKRLIEAISAARAALDDQSDDTGDDDGQGDDTGDDDGQGDDGAGGDE